METVTNHDLLTKVEAIAQGPNGDLLRRFVDILYQQQDYDDEPMSPEESVMVQKGMEAIQRGDKSQFISLEQYERDRGL